MTSGLSRCKFIDWSSRLTNQYLHRLSFIDTLSQWTESCVYDCVVASFTALMIYLCTQQAFVLGCAEFIMSCVTQHWPCRVLVICCNLAVIKKMFRFVDQVASSIGPQLQGHEVKNEAGSMLRISIPISRCHQARFSTSKYDSWVCFVSQTT